MVENIMIDVFPTLYIFCSVKIVIVIIYLPRKYDVNSKLIYVCFTFLKCKNKNNTTISLLYQQYNIYILLIN
jgi:hypothetical protein